MESMGKGPVGCRFSITCAKVRPFLCQSKIESPLWGDGGKKGETVQLYLTYFINMLLNSVS